VEISAPAIPQQQSRAPMIVACCIGVFVFVLLLIAFVSLSKGSTSAATATAPKKQAVGRPEPAHVRLPRAQTRVLVLNANGITGAAAAESDSLRARGYKVSGTGNTAQTPGQSVVLYRPGRRPEAMRLSADEGIPLVGPLDGITPRQLHGAHLVIVLGS
jgi:hypothetical protein